MTFYGSEDKEFLIYNDISNKINENDKEEQEFEGNDKDNKTFSFIMIIRTIIRDNVWISIKHAF